MPESRARALICPGCGADYPLEARWDGCKRCTDAGGNPHWLDVDYDMDGLDMAFLMRAGHVADYAPLLPAVPHDGAPAGATPLIKIDELNAALGVPNLYLKVETVNPTGSFKDRLHAVSIAMARALGFDRAVIITTGNSGVACAAAAAAAGVKLLVITDPLSPPEHRRMMRLFGAHVTAPGNQGPVIAHAKALMQTLVFQHDFYPCTVQGTYLGAGNPYGVEGYKTIAYEVAAQLGRAPDRVCVPTAGGDAIYGPYKGFLELEKLGAIDALPKMTACQAQGAKWDPLESTCRHASLSIL